jgi:hypothetical protein
MSVAGIIQGAVRSAVNVGRIGTCLLAYNPFDILNGVNLQDGVYDTWTLTRGSANATYGPVTYTAPDGQAYSYTFTVTGSTTADDSSDALALFNQKAEITGWYTPSVASNVVTMTARNRGALGVTFADTDSNLTTANSVAGAEGGDIPVGRVLFQAGFGTTAGDRVQKLVLPSDMAFSGTAVAAQIATLTYASSGANDVITTTVSVPALGLEIVASTEYDTSDTATLDAHVIVLNARFDAVFGSGFSIVAARASATITLTAEVAGFAFLVTSSNTGTGGGTWVTVNTTGAVGNPATDAMMTLAGLALDGPGAVPSAEGADDAVYAFGTGVPALRRGQGFRVVSSESWAEGAQLWVSKAAGATDGRLYTTGSSTRLPVPRSRIVATGYDNAAVGRVNINL